MNNGNFLSSHINCTGSLFKKYKDKSPFYYYICLPSIKSPISNDSAPPSTVADAILTDHTTPSIKTFLGKFLQLLEKHIKSKRWSAIFPGGLLIQLYISIIQYGITFYGKKVIFY